MLLPISIVGALLLVSQGVIQTFAHYISFTGPPAGRGQLALGPVASQEIIKELGTNGGGFFNVNSAMPFENATPFSNFVELFAILVIPVSLTWTYGRMVGSRRQGWTIFAAMSSCSSSASSSCYVAEQHGTPAQHAAGVHTHTSRLDRRQHGGQGAALRHRQLGAVDGGHDGHLVRRGQRGFESLTGIGGLVPFTNLSLSETVFGGVGTGLYSMLLFVLLAVFIGGLMVGRTPEYLGKKIEPREIKLVSLAAFFTPLMVLFTLVAGDGDQVRQAVDLRRRAPGLLGDALRLLLAGQQQRLGVRRLHGLLPAERRQRRRHGITFADLLGGLTMMLARFVPILARARGRRSLVAQEGRAGWPGTMRTDTPTFTVLLIGTVVLVGALTFFPALLLGPIVQGMTTRLF